MNVAELKNLIERQCPGWSLEQDFYISASLFDVERSHWLVDQWFLLGHGYEIPESGCYIVRDLLGDSIIIVRDDDRQCRAFYNVCRHRGSRICDDDGRASVLTCPYHAWTYRLDGSLRSAPAMPESIDTSSLGLRQIAIREIGGLIFGSLNRPASELDSLACEITPLLQFHGVAKTRIAARRHYATRANWKLVLENFFECYHCLTAHPEYSSIMRHVDEVGRHSAPAAQSWREIVDRWFKETADRSHPVDHAVFEAISDTQKFRLFRAPIGGNHQTQSQDGKPVAPLLGELCRFDGGFSGFTLWPFVACVTLNDHAILFQFLPAAAELTQVVVTWLVSGSATEKEIDAERMIWLWDRTTQQDTRLIERNAAGVRSRAYQPGPYSTLETGTAGFVSRYLRELKASLAERRC